MKYLPIFEELFSSNSIILMFLTLAITLIISVKLKNTKRKLIGAVISFVIYGICETLSNIKTNNLMEIIILFLGTIAVGAFAGFSISFIVSKIRK